MQKNQAISVENRRARFEYEFKDTYEAGIVLTGSEVKSIRAGHVSIEEAYIGPWGSGLALINAFVAVYPPARENHAPKRARPLLLHKREINKIVGAIEREGMTAVPAKLFFDARGRVKIAVAVARGKKLHDKRQSIKARDWERQKSRIMADA